MTNSPLQQFKQEEQAEVEKQAEENEQEAPIRPVSSPNRMTREQAKALEEKQVKEQPDAVADVAKIVEHEKAEVHQEKSAISTQEGCDARCNHASEVCYSRKVNVQ